MKRTHYESELTKLEVELAKLQAWVRAGELRVVVIFEGRDAAGKGGTIKTITRRLNPRVVRTVALTKPTEREQSQWYLQRYIPHLPSGGEMVLFDRSWYNRLGVEKVMGFCTDEEYEAFLALCPAFEQVLVETQATMSRRSASRQEIPIRSGAGSCLRWISRPARGGWTTRKLETSCSSTRAPNGPPGIWRTSTTSVRAGST